MSEPHRQDQEGHGHDGHRHDGHDGHGHGHTHDHRGANARSLTIVLGITGFYLVAEVAAGLLTGSLALLADAGHMLTDVGGLALALFAMRLASRPATAEHTYGLYRAEILAAVANAVVLLGISVFVLVEAYGRFRAPPHVRSPAMLAVAVVGLLINVAGALVLRKGAGSSLNMKGAYFEVVSDLVTSVGVIVAALVMWGTGWYYADPLVSAAIGLFIVPRTWRLLREAVAVLLEGTPSDVNVAALREAIAGLPGIASLHDLHVWSLTSGMNAMSLHVVLADDCADHDEARRTVFAAVAAGFPIRHMTIQVERGACGGKEIHH